MFPTGSLEIAAERMRWARESEQRMNLMVEDEFWYGAMSASCECAERKARVGLEFLLWMLAALHMPVEPTAREIEAVNDARKLPK